MFKKLMILMLLFLIPIVSAATVNITPLNPNTNNDLSCNVDGTTIGISFNWFINNVFVRNGITLDNSYTNVNDLVRCDAWAPGIGGMIFVGSDSVNIINRMPVVSDIPDVIMDEDTTYTFDLTPYVTDPDNDIITWTVSGTNNNFSVTINNGIATLTPALNWNGQITLTFTANDGNGGSDSDAVLVTVNPVYDPFSFDLPNQLATNEDIPIVVDLDNYVINPDNNPLTFTITSVNFNLNAVIDPVTHIITITPTANWNGNEDLTIQVTDGVTTETDTVNILVNAVDDTPVINSFTPNIGNVVLNEGANQVFSVTATDVDNPTLFYTWYLDNNLVLTGSSTYNFDALDGPSTHTLRARVSDGNTFVENIWNINEVNVDPVADAGGPFVCSLNSSLNLNGIGTDVPADSLTYAWDLDNDLVYEVNGQQAVFNCNTLGSFTVNLQVTDDDNGIGTDSAVINVIAGPVNNPPFFNPPLQNQTGQINQLFTYDIDASDVDVGDILTFSDNTILFDINPVTGLISFTPTLAGVYNIGITVCDDSGLPNACTTDTFTLIITSGSTPVVVITQPNVDPFTLNFGNQLNLTGTGNDLEDGILPGASLTWSEGVIIYGTGNSTTLNSLSLGIHIITLTGVDSDGNIGTDTITINVVPQTACSDGADNDSDGLTDLNDPGCSNSQDNDETDPVSPPACSDGIDNDSDGLIDYPNDLGCLAAGDTDEQQAPVANAGNDQNVNVNTQVNFSGSLSSDIDGNIVSYLWDFGDNTTALGVNANHTYTSPGIYTTTLTVTDNNGLTSTDTLTVTVNQASGNLAGNTEDTGIEHDFSIVSAIVKGDFKPGNKITLLLKVRNDGDTNENIDFDVYVSDLLIHKTYTGYLVREGNSEYINLDLILPGDFDVKNYVIKIVAHNRYDENTKYVNVNAESSLKNNLVSGYANVVDKVEEVKRNEIASVIIFTLLIILILVGIIIALRALKEEQYWLN